MPAFILLALFLSSTSAEAAFDGTAWQRLDKFGKGLYLRALFDLVEIVGYEEKAFKADTTMGELIQVTSCLRQRNMTLEQIVAIVQRYLDTHPEHWHILMPALTVVALQPTTEACGKH
jgi:hypothetical protein